MKNMVQKLGFWSAVMALFLFALWTLSFIVLLSINPAFLWTNLGDYILQVKETPQIWKYIAQAAMMLFGPVYILLLLSLRATFTGENKILLDASILFATIFAACSGIHYFIQLSVVPQSIQSGQLNGLEQFIQANPYSGIAGLNMTGWTLFLGLSALFASLAFHKKKDAKMIRLSLLASGIICLTGGIAYINAWILLVFLTMNLLMGLALLIAIWSLLNYFKHGLW